MAEEPVVVEEPVVEEPPEVKVLVEEEPAAAMEQVSEPHQSEPAADAVSV